MPSISFLRLGLWLCAGALALPVQAHEGHDDAPAAAATASAPRFVASSELFELVGVVQGRQLSLYLDHAGDNRPVADAELAIDWAGQPLRVQRVAEGQYQAELPAPLAEGETAVSATIVAGAQSDLLAAELDWHAPAEGPAAAKDNGGKRTRWLAGAAGLSGVLFGLWSLWRERRRAQAPRQGGAA